MRLSVKLTAIFSLLIILTVSAVSYLVYTESLGLLENHIKDRLENQAFHTMDKINGLFRERYGDVKTLASDPVLRSRNSTPEQITERLKVYKDNYNYTSLSFFDLNRITIADTEGSAIGKRHPLSGYWMDIEAGKDFVFGIYRSESLGVNVVYFLHVVKDWSGNKIGFVVARLFVEQLTEIVTRSVGRLNIEKNFNVELLDEDGLVLYSNRDKEKILTAKSDEWEVVAALVKDRKGVGSLRYTHQKGGQEEDILAYATESAVQEFIGHGWTLIIEAPTRVVFAPAVAMQKKILAAASFIMIISLGLVYLFSRRFSRPVEKMSKAAAKIERGDLDVRVDAESNDEVGELASSFNTMARSLKESYATLETRIRERTAALQESEERYRAIFETSMDAILTISPPDWTYTSCNTAAVRLFKAKDMNEFFSIAPWKLSPEFQPSGRRSRELAKEMIEIALKEGSYSFNWIHRRLDGEEFPALVTATRFEIDGQRWLQGVIRDMTEIRRTEQEYGTLLATTQDGFWEVDTQGRIVDVNDAYCRLSGYTKEELLKMRILDIEAVQSPEEVANNIKKIMRTGYGRFETRHYRKDGTIIDIEVSTNYREYKGGRFYAFLTDISERKAAESAVLKAKVDAEKANSAKSMFLANMSHEIRTPMNAIIGLAYLAGETGLDRKQRDYLNKIQSAAQSLMSIINEILDFSKIESGMLELDFMEFDLAEVTEQIGNIISFSAEEKGIEIIFRISPETPRRLVGDPTRLSQVLTNLINNAVKFTEKGEVLVRIEEADVGRESILMRFSVTDTGIGMTEEQIKNLFQPFSQADASITRRFGGTGLGLTICKRILDKMDGEISVTSSPGKGSTFSFTTRFGRPPSGQEPCCSTPSDLKGLRILVVDDNDTVRELVCEILSSFSFAATAVSSGKEAIEELERVSRAPEEIPYRLMLLDWRMPGMDGIATAGKIKESRDLRHPPVIIMVTALEKEEIRKEAENAGVKALLSKPLHPSVLFNSIMESLGRKTVVYKPKRGTGPQVDMALKRLGGAKILLVEDQPINRQVAEEILARAGIKVTVAENGREALRIMAEGKRFDAILMDIQMPEMDGYDATRLIRKDDQATPIIAMTAYALAEERDRCIAAGMNDHLSKPIEPSILYNTLIKWVKPGEREKSIPVEKKEEDEDWISIPRDLPGIDVESALERTMGSKELFRKLVLSFARKKSSAVEEIRQLVNTGDMDKAGDAVHSIVGLSGNVSAVKVLETSRKLEKAVRKGEIENIQPLLDELGERMKEVLESANILGSLSQEEAVPAGPRADRKAAFALMKDLVAMLELHDLESTSAMKRLHNVVSGMGFDQELSHLNDLIGRLRFGEAKDALLSLMVKSGFSSEGGSDDRT